MKKNRAAGLALIVVGATVAFIGFYTRAQQHEVGNRVPPGFHKSVANQLDPVKPRPN